MEHLERTVEAILKVPVNRTTCVLFYLSKVFNIDISYLYFLHKKYGEDIFYFFFMLSGKKISIPKEDRFLLLFKSADEIYDKITKNPDKVINKAKDLEIYTKLINSLNNDTMEIEL